MSSSVHQVSPIAASQSHYPPPHPPGQCVHLYGTMSVSLFPPHAHAPSLLLFCFPIYTKSKISTHLRKKSQTYPRKSVLSTHVSMTSPCCQCCHRLSVNLLKPCPPAPLTQLADFQTTCGINLRNSVEINARWLAASARTTVDTTSVHHLRVLCRKLRVNKERFYTALH